MGPVPDSRQTTRFDWFAAAAITAVFAVGWFVVGGWRNVPVIDDWAYAWSVEHLLQTGKLVVLNRSSCYPIVQILWATLFARIFGFSFGAIRLSTVALAVFGCVALYLTLKEVGIRARAALLATLTVALYPVFFVLVYSFMTDVPFLALSMISFYFYVSGVKRDAPGRLWAGSLFAVLAFLVRQIGVLMPLAVFAAVDRDTLTRRSLLRFWLPTLAGVAGVAIFWFALPVVFGRLFIIDDRVANLSALMSMKLSGYISWNLELLWIIALPLAPLLVCQLTRWPRAAGIAALAAAVVVALKALSIAVPSPIYDGQTWSLQTLALSTNLVGGELPPSGWSLHLTPWLKAIGTLSLAALIVTLPSLRARDKRGVRILLAAAALHLAMINVAWLYYDRYYLVFAPALALCAAAALSDAKYQLWPASALLAVWAFVSLSGTRYVLDFNKVLDDMTNDLQARGVAPADINAGYSLNGWRLYVHPENRAPKMGDWDIPFVTNDWPTPYRIVTVPDSASEVLRTERIPSALWQVTDRVYLVKARDSKN
jgi:hypothetical protein